MMGGDRNSARHYEEVFVDYLTRVQDSHPGLIPGEVEVGCKYGFGRSGRRGLMTHLRNMAVKPDDIESRQMWRKLSCNYLQFVVTDGDLQETSQVDIAIAKFFPQAL